eukprot:TRINITY_DN4502_c0_g2_i1.p1 TRINITY_DN4502_c0_g2~~TRINITY_DN4502_c0_g2_i1.p1  ORF type:complete len:173 (+),score=35.76 TRINITY_DN4502_c0_g2_i1:333-851(+)
MAAGLQRRAPPRRRRRRKRRQPHRLHRRRSLVDELHSYKKVTLCLAGCHGYILKALSKAGLLAKMRQVAGKECVFATVHVAVEALQARFGLTREVRAVDLLDGEHDAYTALPLALDTPPPDTHPTGWESVGALDLQEQAPLLAGSSTTTQQPPRPRPPPPSHRNADEASHPT